MAYAMTFKPDFLERCKRMSGLKSNAAFAGEMCIRDSGYGDGSLRHDLSFAIGAHGTNVQAWTG